MSQTLKIVKDILTQEIIGRGTKRGGCTTLMNLAQEELITCITQPVAKKDRFGFGIVV